MDQAEEQSKQTKKCEEIANAGASLLVFIWLRCPAGGKKQEAQQHVSKAIDLALEAIQEHSIEQTF